jgi:hypothetical protein
MCRRDSRWRDPNLFPSTQEASTLSLHNADLERIYRDSECDSQLIAISGNACGGSEFMDCDFFGMPLAITSIFSLLCGHFVAKRYIDSGPELPGPTPD